LGDRSSIEWTEATWNPTTGCDRTSPGCDNCYALALAKRLKAMGVAKYQHDGDAVTSGPGFQLTIHSDALEQPLRWRQPRLIFVNSMSDLFHPDVPLEFIRDVLDVIRDTPRHTYQVLTKRSQRLAREGAALDWPPNCWVGVTVEQQSYTFRIRHLRQVPAAVRFLSCEPLLGDLGEIELDGIDWVIAGGESGPNARPMLRPWAIRLRDHCRRADVPFFFKQWGGRTPKANGRHLDGRTWDQMPARLLATAP
jgi:protein gp37